MWCCRLQLHAMNPLHLFHVDPFLPNPKPGSNVSGNKKKCLLEALSAVHPISSNMRQGATAPCCCLSCPHSSLLLIARPVVVEWLSRGNTFLDRGCDRRENLPKTDRGPGRRRQSQDLHPDCIQTASCGEHAAGFGQGLVVNSKTSAIVALRQHAWGHGSMACCCCALMQCLETETFLQGAQVSRPRPMQWPNRRVFLCWMLDVSRGICARVVPDSESGAGQIRIKRELKSRGTCVEGDEHEGCSHKIEFVKWTADAGIWWCCTFPQQWLR
ncbi:hypothetical protein QBC39DRAFT_119126 [Podospora conica]|nr:hypothetical protein QBC39DRAFT_119126 [Schizothecium conicum]